MNEVQCPNCGETCLEVAVGKDEKPVRCRGCDEEFSLDELKQISARFLQLVAWVESSPFRT